MPYFMKLLIVVKKKIGNNADNGMVEPNNTHTVENNNCFVFTKQKSGRSSKNFAFQNLWRDLAIFENLWFSKMAERSGFEPEGPVTQSSCLAGNCIQPLCHLSTSIVYSRKESCAVLIYTIFIPGNQGCHLSQM